jgi:uncharacterized protein (DUF1330 family)
MPVTHCVLLWARPGQEAALASYEDRVLALASDHGGRVLQRGQILPDAAGSPTEVQLLEWESESGLDGYINDPRRSAMAAERDAAIVRTDVHRIQLR